MLWFYKFNSLVKTILSSGDGRKEKTAFVVTRVPDEYLILEVLGLQMESQALTGKRGKRYDVLYLTENEHNLKSLYFDINLFFGKGF
jgi:predicted RNA-binding protein associated with RNAse of E/G family